MNKQELINELKRISLEKQHKALTHPESKNYYEGMVMAYSQVVHMVNTVLKLDEPKKPVVPQFVADLVDWTNKMQCAPSDVIRDLHDNGDLANLPRDLELDKLSEYFEKAYCRYDFEKACFVGYEVEKEPLYEVIIGDLYLIKKFNNRNDFCFDTSCSLCAWEKSAYQLTEAEIKSIDERYWPFAVPVEEVAEG
ncbi:TPA: DUF1642 domain-containing protein [Enterococcus faecium]|uniref:DUF1642 domain-containing protein n=1 Tax=Enterococcus faecium TaxID=1352 RepID=UPI002380A47C|nr:DUF1642 domain-containing protein [Enterococcus faecium]WDW16974.1 DUF1642 domain-containing protein [Enterococcus faecium]